MLSRPLSHASISRGANFGFHAGMDISEIRRSNLHALVRKYGGQAKLGELVEKDLGYVKWIAEKMDAKSKDQRRVKGAAQTILGQPLNVGGGGTATDDDIPFAVTI